MVVVDQAKLKAIWEEINKEANIQLPSEREENEVTIIEWGELFGFSQKQSKTKLDKLVRIGLATRRKIMLNGSMTWLYLPKPTQSTT